MLTLAVVLVLLFAYAAKHDRLKKRQLLRDSSAHWNLPPLPDYGLGPQASGLSQPLDTNARNYHYCRKPGLVSDAELSFLRVIETALGPDYRVFPKVRVGDVLTVGAHTDSAWWAGFNTISAKHFDYLVCRRADCGVLFAIELDDQSHQRGDRQRRDQLLDDACNEAGLPLHRFRVQKTYSVQAVKKQLLQLPFAA